jgi:hypothetical protein
MEFIDAMKRGKLTKKSFPSFLGYGCIITRMTETLEVGYLKYLWLYIFEIF